jgi:hypothetical protein
MPLCIIMSFLFTKKFHLEEIKSEFKEVSLGTVTGAYTSSETD